MFPDANVSTCAAAIPLGPRWVWVSFLIICLAGPCALAFLDSSKIPRKGDYDEIRVHGIVTSGVVEGVSQDSDADDDHWTVIHFNFSRDGREDHGVAYTWDGGLRVGDSVPVHDRGDQAILPNMTPVDVNPINNFLLVFLFLSLLISPITIAVLFITIVSSLSGKKESPIAQEPRHESSRKEWGSEIWVRPEADAPIHPASTPDQSQSNGTTRHTRPGRFPTA
jgi:hypothetical protein